VEHAFFEDIRLEVEDSPTNPNAKILVYYVTERPIIRRIEYKGNKSITESDILDRFKERKVGLSVESQFDPTKIKRAEVVLKELLAEHGRQFATVKPTYERIAATNAVKLVFNIDEGPKVKVGEIKFDGNKAFSDRKLVRAMKHDRPYSIPLGFTEIPVLSKTYDRQKLDEDLEIGGSRALPKQWLLQSAGKGSSSKNRRRGSRRNTWTVASGMVRNTGNRQTSRSPLKKASSIGWE